MGRKYPQIVDGDWVRPKRRGYRDQCCHCGLIHAMDFRIVRRGSKRYIEFRAVQDGRATAGARRPFRFSKEDKEDD